VNFKRFGDLPDRLSFVQKPLYELHLGGRDFRRSTEFDAPFNSGLSAGSGAVSDQIALEFSHASENRSSIILSIISSSCCHRYSHRWQQTSLVKPRLA
jgi:hypothetical protein